MATQPFYNTGTAVLTNGSTAMVGTGTFWMGNIRAFDRVVGLDGKEAIVAAVVDNTHITLARNWPGTTQATAAYEIWMSPDEIFLQTLARAIFETLKSSILTALSTLTPTANKLIYFDGGSNVALADLTAAGRALLDDANASAQLDTLGFTALAKSIIAASTGIATLDLLTNRGADIASAATVVLNASTGDIVDITGTVATTAITLADGEVRWTRAAAAWPLTVGASLILNNGGANYTCAAGDLIMWRGYAAGVVRGTIFPIDGFGAATSALGQSLIAQTSAALMQSVMGVREVLTANRTYFVRPDGNDANTGLVNNSGGAFLTNAKALAVAATLDFGGFTVTIQIVDGTYTGGVAIPVCVGQKSADNLVIQGNNATPANVIISTTSADCFICSANAMATIKDMELRTTTGGNCLAVNGPGALLQWGNIRFGACAGAHVYLAQGKAQAIGAYAITGGAAQHWWASGGGTIVADFIAVTLSGTPAFSYAFALAQTAIIQAFSTFPGTGATGTRYQADGGAIKTVGGGATLFPGNLVGTCLNGGFYS